MAGSPQQKPGMDQRPLESSTAQRFSDLRLHVDRLLLPSFSQLCFSPINSSRKYLLSTYDVPGTVLGAGDTTVSETDPLVFNSCDPPKTMRLKRRMQEGAESGREGTFVPELTHYIIKLLMFLGICPRYVHHVFLSSVLLQLRVGSSYLHLASNPSIRKTLLPNPKSILRSLLHVFPTQLNVLTAEAWALSLWGTGGVV